MSPTTKKVIYLVPLGIALLISGISFLQWPLQNGDVVFFHINTFGVTFHYILDVIVWSGLFWIFMTSKKNCLIAFDTKHSTVIARK